MKFNILQKFSDEELLELNNKGYSDRYIAKVFNCSQSAVTTRRWRLRLPANFTNNVYPEKTIEQMAKWHKKEIKKRKQPNFFKNYPRLSSKKYHERYEKNYGRKYINKLYYEWKKRNPEKYKADYMRYYQKHREEINKRRRK